MKLIPLEDLPRLHTTPLAKVVFEGEENQVVVEADDTSERRWRFLFSPHQALRVTTSDCFDTPGRLPIVANTIVEVSGSVWIKELKSALARSDHNATFMDKARHFLLPCQDEYIEVVAWEVRCEPVEVG